MTDLVPKARFPLPENWEVEDTVCAIVCIPDDTQYLAMLIGLLDTLKWSESYDRDETKTGAAIVSRTWQAALESLPITIGECGQMTLRQNPDDPCQLQQSVDGGETWTLAFDYALCSAVITVPAPYPESETGASDAAAASVRNIFEALTNMVDCEASREAYIAAATAYMRTFDPAYANPIALGAIYDAFCALSEEDQDLYKSDCPFDEHKSDLEACAAANGLYDWLNCGAEMLNDWLNEAGSDIMNALNQAAAALSGNGWQLSSQGGEGGGAGFGADCDLFSHTFDFRIDDQNWSLASGTTDVPGTGLVNGFVSAEGGVDSLNAFADGFSERFISWVDIEFVQISGGHDSIVEIRGASPINAVLQGSGMYRFTIGENRTQIQVVIDAHRSAFGVSEFKIVTATFHGQGSDPF